MLVEQQFPHRRVPVSLNKARFRQLSSFIPTCPTSPNFPQWAIKSCNLNIILSNAVDPDSEDDKVVSNSSLMSINSEINVNSEQASLLELSGKYLLLLLF